MTPPDGPPTIGPRRFWTMTGTGSQTVNSPDAPRMAEAAPGDRLPARTGYYVEGWRGSECVGWSYVVHPATAVRRAEWLATDLGADAIYVRWTGRARGLAASWTLGGSGWLRVDDRRLAAILTDLGVWSAR